MRRNYKNNCIACGMPMTKDDDFALKDRSKNFCTNCMRPDGTMQNYEEKLQNLTEFIIKTQGLAEEKAHEAAKQMMANLPAWKNHSR
ncbi:MAG: zinc ribbon domain-containing protein [Chitinivibrionales bacterium]|nr:zinc ribbon domain-containing protein [Chitinivibrionales bacterium]